MDTVNVEMACYIWSIFQHSIIPLSWGIDFCHIKLFEQGTEFHVQGFLMSGIVRVEYDEGSDTFTVTLAPDDTTEAKVIESVYFDNLISVIDENVEHCKDYENKVRKSLGNKVAV